MNILSLSALIKFGRIWACRLVVVDVDSFFSLFPFRAIWLCDFVSGCECVCRVFFFGKVKNSNANVVVCEQQN